MSHKNEDRKIAIYDFINDFISEYGVSPSVREVAEGVGCSVGAAHKYINRLIDEGLLERFGHNQIITRMNEAPMGRYPVVGAIACGKPKLAIQDIETYIPMSKEILGNGEFFVLVADGDSMIEAGIDAGDLVFIRKQTYAEEGQIVAALIQDDYSSECYATLKRYYRDPANKRFILHPENESMDDIYVKEVNIIGVAVKILKNVS